MTAHQEAIQQLKDLFLNKFEAPVNAGNTEMDLQELESRFFSKNS